MEGIWMLLALAAMAVMGYGFLRSITRLLDGESRTPVWKNPGRGAIIPHGNKSPDAREQEKRHGKETTEA